MLDLSTIEEFLAQKRLAVIGASDKKDSFARTIYKALKEHGYDAVAVNPQSATVDGDPCYPDITDVPGHVEGAIVMVPADKAIEVVRQCAAAAVPRVWLFKGIGSPGAMSEEAADLCRFIGIDVVAGACPLMFLEPVGWFHRLHRAARHANRSLAKAS